MHTQASDPQTDIRCHWLDVLEENHVTFIALDPVHDTNLIEQLLTHPGWVVEYTDEDAILFLREIEVQAQ